MIDFGKLYCGQHPNELISNFCLQQSCLAGLCATCICTHTRQHITNKTSPQYQNIRTTYSTMHETIRKDISSIDTQKARIVKLNQFIHIKRKTLKQNIQQVKTEAVKAVEKFFQNKEKRMLREMQNEERKQGLHSETRMESLMNSLARETSCLITAAQELNSQSFLESYQRIKSQTLVNSGKLIRDVSQELDRNEGFQTVINSNESYLQQLTKILEFSLGLNFKISQNCKSSNNNVNYNQASSFGACQQSGGQDSERSLFQGTSQFGGIVNTQNSNTQNNNNLTINNGSPRQINQSRNGSAMSFSQTPSQSNVQIQVQGQPRQSLQNSRQTAFQQATSKSITYKEEDQEGGKTSFINKLNNPALYQDSNKQNISAKGRAAQSQIFSNDSSHLSNVNYRNNVHNGSNANNGKDRIQRSQSMDRPVSHSSSMNNQNQLVISQSLSSSPNLNGNWNGNWSKHNQYNQLRAPNHQMSPQIQPQSYPIRQAQRSASSGSGWRRVQTQPQSYSHLPTSSFSSVLQPSSTLASSGQNWYRKTPTTTPINDCTFSPTHFKMAVAGSNFQSYQQPSSSISSKHQFIPQIYDTSQFSNLKNNEKNIDYHQSQQDIRKMKKSGLSLLKPNASISSRHN